MRKTADSNKPNKVYDCPVEAALDVLGGKWGLPIVARLAVGTQRYSELKRSLPSISEKMLIKQLRQQRFSFQSLSHLLFSQCNDALHLIWRQVSRFTT